MGPLEIILIIACAAVVIGVAVSYVIKRKQGKTGCDCGECGGNCACCAAAKAATLKSRKENDE